MMINLTIDGQPVSVPAGTSIVNAALSVGIKIPTLCHRPELKPFTSCFICVVEIKGEPKLVPACSTSVREGITVLTDSAEVRNTRKVCIELLISEHFGDCVSPCRTSCPADCNIQEYLAALKQGDNQTAIRLIKETISLPSSIGRVCPRPCESTCRRQHLEGSAAICSLKRFAGDEDLKSGQPYQPPVLPANGQKVAVIGSGPAGLNAAYFLTIQGYSVTIIEAQPQPGGMLRWGIPQYRLPKEVLDQEIQQILKLGVQIRYNTVFGKDITQEQLQAEGFGAILLAIGAQKAAAMRVEGEDLPGVLSGIGFLEKIIKGEKVELGQEVIIVGGGNTAIDAARTARRLGAKVTLIYRRTKNEMPAEKVEVHAAEEEGINFQFLTAPLKVSQQNKRLVINCLKMQLGEADSSGRRSPVAIPNSEYDIFADTIISAIGQKIDTAYVEKIGVKITKDGRVIANDKTTQTNLPQIFAAGDCVLGPNIASAAIGAGRQAAIAISQYLQKEEVRGEEKLYAVTMGSLEDVPEDFYKDVAKATRHKMPELAPEKRVSNFSEVELGFAGNVVDQEAAICLECGCRQADSCLLREYATQYQAKPSRWLGAQKPFFIDKTHPQLIFESNKCILCGCCVRYGREIKNQDIFGFVDRGIASVVRPAFNKPLGEMKFDFAEELAEVCPTGAISLKRPLPQ